MTKKIILILLLLCMFSMTSVGLCKDKSKTEVTDWWIPVIEDIINGKDYLVYSDENYLGGFFIANFESGKMIDAWVTTDKGIQKLPAALVDTIEKDVGKPVDEKDRFHWKLKRINFTLHMNDDQGYIEIGVMVAPLAGHGMRYEVKKDKDNKKRIIVSSGKMTWIS